jgi:hypothetical protein
MPFDQAPNPFAGENPMQPASEFPLALLDGQPISVEQAAARMETLKTDENFQKRVAAKDPAAFAEHLKLWRITRHLPAEVETPINSVDVIKESIGRDLAIAETRADSLRDVGFTETQVYQYLNGRPIPFEEKQIHERELARLQKSPDFVQKYMRNDPEAVLKMRLLHVGLSMRVGTLDQINEWERLHEGRKPKAPA